MSMIDKPARDVTESDLLQAIATCLPEGQRLEYKERIAKDRRDLVKAIVGMANTQGGLIVFGVKEKRTDGKPTGEPEEICGLGALSADDATLPLSNALRDIASPRLVPPPEFAHLSTSYGSVVVVRVMPSMQRPHMVNHSFPARQGPQTVKMDLGQVRAAFLEEYHLAERFRNFRAERIADILSESYQAWGRSANVIIHAFPLDAFGDQKRVDLLAVQRARYGAPGIVGPCSHRITFDGLLTSKSHDGDASLFRILRNGTLEFATNGLVNEGERHGPGVRKHLYPGAIAKIMAIDFPRVIKTLGEEVIGFPLAIALSLHGVMNAHAFPVYGGYGAPIDRDHVVIPELIIDKQPDDWGMALKELLDQVWQGMNVNECPLYSGGEFDNHACAQGGIFC